MVRTHGREPYCGRKINLFRAWPSFEPFGEKRWAWTIGTAGEDDAVDVAVDGDDRIYVVGSAEIAPEKRYGAKEAYLVRFDAGGGEHWRPVNGGNGPDRSRCVAVAPDGDVYVAGSTGPGTPRGVLNVLPVTRGFFAKYSPSGMFRRAGPVGLRESRSPEGLAVGPESGPYLAGREEVGDDTYDSYLASYDSVGARNCAEFTATPEDEIIRDIVVDVGGTIYAVGRTDHGYEGQPFQGENWDGFSMVFE
jgi:hypothetical protein